MFGRSKNVEESQPQVKEHPDRPRAKNRPTPSRREAEAARRVPLVPSDRKAAARQAREKARAARLSEQRAMRTGDEAHLPARDRGPEMRFVRNYVDARRNVGEIALYAVLVLAAMTLTRNLMLAQIANLLMLSLVGFWVVDSWILSRRLKKAVVERFGEAALARRPVWYGVMRALQARWLRLPKPQVKHGEFPK